MQQILLHSGAKVVTMLRSSRAGGWSRDLFWSNGGAAFYRFARTVHRPAPLKSVSSDSAGAAPIQPLHNRRTPHM